MLRRFWQVPLAKLALLITGLGALCCAQVPPSTTGSLAGKLTDSHSVPLQYVALTLRNAATGVEQHATTTRGGRYRFIGLVEGEYVLTAMGPQGRGGVEGIFVAAGHEAQVQTALDFLPLPPVAGEENTQGEQAHNSSPNLPVSLAGSFHPNAEPVAIPTRIAEAAFVSEEKLDMLSLSSRRRLQQPPPNPRPDASSANTPEQIVPSLKKFPVPNSNPAAPVTVALAVIPAPALKIVLAELSPQTLDLASISQSSSGLNTNAALRNGSEQQDPQSLDASQLQSLPQPNRDWQSFLLDSAPTSPDSSDRESNSSQSPGGQQITVDGAPVALAFGSTGTGRSRNSASAFLAPGSGDAIIRNAGSADSLSASAQSSERNRLEIQTQRGTEQMHGQAFLFDRQNLWGARNPFTQWVQETAPASPAAIPKFTAQPYSPGDRNALWGVGLGGVIHRRRLFWFAALDGFERNDPGVASVKHPDEFFAQPSNDQMQLLSAQLGLSGTDPVSEGLAAYSKLLESLAALLGPTHRRSSQLIGFLRADWSLGERHRFTLEASGANLDSPGGGFTRASETYGSHSFGSVRAIQQWLLGRWEAFITPNLLASTQASFGHNAQSTPAASPSAFEQALNVNAWGQLPQIVVDSRYGFTIGNPARFGRGSYPNEDAAMAQEQLSWVRAAVMLKAGIEISHNRDATGRLRNQTGTYYYSTLEDFASDALAFAAFGLNGQLNPMDQHNCDQRGRPWRDTTGVLHGLGYLPCYSYYSQTMGPSDWWLSTNDWAGYATSQWQPTRRAVLTLALRWELEQLPPPIARLENPDLPLTERLPSLGNQFGPRAAFAWGTGESRWPVVRLGYGMYFARTRNSVIETALTQTGSLKGDLNFFMRPTDNFNAGGAPPFPYVLAGEPASVVKPSAVEFAPNFRNGEVHQAEAAIEESLPGHFHLEAAAVASLGRRLPVTFDANIDPAANPKTITYAVIDGNGSGPIKSPQITIPFFASWPSTSTSTGFAGRLNPNYQQVSEIYSRANSTYEAAMVRVSRNARNFTLRLRYTYAHATDFNPDETSQVGGPSVLDPIDFHQEYGTSSLDVRHSATTAVIWQPKWKLNQFAGRFGNGWMLSGVGHFRSGLPYTMHTSGSLAKIFTTSGTAIVGLSTGMNGYGGDNRVYGVGRNTYRYPSTWKADLRLSKRFDLGQMRQLELMAESFNLFNHQNVTELETTGYYVEPGTVNGSLPRLNFLTGLKSGQTEFGKPLNINATDFYRERQMQFGARLRF